MAKRQVQKYLFVPGGVGVGRTGGDGFSGYIAVEGKQDLYKLLLITNVTRGIIYYNFADTQNTGATVTYRPGGIKTNDADNSVVTYDDIPAGTGTVGTALLQNGITLGETYIYITDIDTSTHNPGDELSIFVEEKYFVLCHRSYEAFSVGSSSTRVQQCHRRRIPTCRPAGRSASMNLSAGCRGQWSAAALQLLLFGSVG